MVELRHRSEGTVLETERTRLRPHRLSDFEHVVALWSDRTVIEHITPDPLPRSEAWTRLLRYVGHWALLPYGYWVVEDKQNGEFLGEVGFADWKREIEPSIEGLPEMGWALKSSVHGQGIGTETVDAALRWADEHIDANQSVALIDPEHAVSIRLAEKTGFRQAEITTYKDSPVIIFRRERRISQ